MLFFQMVHGYFVMHTFRAFLTLCVVDSALCVIGAPSWQSGWIRMASQQSSESFKEIDHNLAELPLKVKVLVRPTSGPNANYVFEAVGSAMWDDDYEILYCGLVYMYSDTSIRLWAPMSTSGYSLGQIFCSGIEGWTQDYRQEAVEADINVLIWLAASLPITDFMTDWVDIDVRVVDDIYWEYEITEPLDLVVVQTRVVDSGELWISEGLGSSVYDSAYTSKSVGSSGIVYAHSDDEIRLWLPYRGYADSLKLAYSNDGWSTVDGMVESYGEMRVLGWSMPEPIYEHSIDVDLDNGSSLTQLLLNPKKWSNLQSLLTLKVTPARGPNENFSFYSNGVTSREGVAGYGSYGGAIFGYSDSRLRLWYPSLPEGCLVAVTAPWGNSQNTDCNRKATITLQIWAEEDTTEKQSAEISRSISCKMKRSSSATSTNDNMCAIRCLTESNCVASRPLNGDCDLMNIQQATTAMDNPSVADTLTYPTSCN